MLQTGIRSGVLAVRAIKEVFRPENYREFRIAQRRGEDIPEESRHRVDGQVYDKMGERYGVAPDDREEFWKRAMDLANSTINYARGILFADQERQATLTNDIVWDDGRPSSALEILTMPARLVGEQCRYEQGRKLVLAGLGAEIIIGYENGHSKTVLKKVNDFLEKNLFIGRKGDPQNYHTFSYHRPGTNELVGFSSQYPDPNFAEELWVKSLDYPVRTMGIKDEAGEMVPVGQALYDPREKELEALVIKALHRSLKANGAKSNGGLIETSPYTGDRLGFRLVIMEGGHPLRDRLTAHLEELFKTFDDYDEERGIEEDDEPDPDNGNPDRFKSRRRQVYIKNLTRPLEVIIQSLEDYVSQLYEVGRFDPEKNMHDGPAHDLYKLGTVVKEAYILWPPTIFPKIRHRESQKSSSFEYATRLGRKQRIYPPPYIGEN